MIIKGFFNVDQCLKEIKKQIYIIEKNNLKKYR